MGLLALAVAECSRDEQKGTRDAAADAAAVDGATADLKAHPMPPPPKDAASPFDSGAKACQNPPCVNVINNCPFPIWVHGANSSVTLQPDNARIDTGAVQQYDVPPSWPAARVNAFWVDPNGTSPDPSAFDKVELTVGGGAMSYNITYVDYVALPVMMEALAATCPKTSTFDPAVSCDVPVANLLGGCPAGLLDGKRCLSAGLYCASGHDAEPFCHALDKQIAACAQANPSTCGIATKLGNTTANVYSCSGYFDSQTPGGCTSPSNTCHIDGNKWCAALNRSMLPAPDSTDGTLYYQNAPFNTYAQWVHQTCPGIYAFPYDDYPSTAGQSGFRSCTADRLDITFCPAG
jgi:hypothetical protein